MISNTFTCLTWFFCCASMVMVHAQTVELYPDQLSLKQTGFVEPATQPEYSRVGVFYHAVGGNFARPQLPDRGMAGGFKAAGRQQVKQLVWEGLFAYRYQQDRGQALNNTSLHPDIQPYLWADTALGRWDRNYFDARVQFREVSQKKVQWGGSLFFRGGQGDRLNDPRPLYRFRSIGIAAALYLHSSDTRWGALELFFSSFSEDNEMGFFSVDDPLLYRLRGYGTFSRSAFVSGERQLRSHKTGISLKWKNDEQFSAFFSATAAFGEAQEGLAITTPAGEWQSLMALLRLSRRWVNPYDPKIVFNGFVRENAGTDPVFGLINARLQTAGSGITAQLHCINSSRLNWYAQTGAGWEIRFQEDLASFTEANLQVLPIKFAAGVRRNYERLSPFLAISGSYRLVFRESLKVGDATEITDRLVRDDFRRLSTDYYRLTVQGGLEQKNEQGRVRFSIKLSRQQAIDPNNLYQNLATFSLSFFPKYARSQTPFELI